MQRKVVSGNDLLKYQAKCYRTVIDELKGSWLSRGKVDLLRRTLMHAMNMERRRLVLAWRRLCARLEISLAQSSRAAPHRAGRRQGFPRQGRQRRFAQPSLRQDAPAGPRRAGADGPGELDRVRFFLERYAGLAELMDYSRFSTQPDGREGCFLIRKDEAGPGRSLQKWHNLQIQNGDQLLDCGPLLKRMRSQIDALEHGALPSKIGLPSVAHRPQYVAMMKNLLTLWSEPPSRRSHRQNFLPRVELAVGLDVLWALLSGATHKRRRGDPAEPPADIGTVELSEWSVVNESPTGFALQYLNGESSVLSVGALVGVRSQDRSKTHICLARRLVSGNQRRAELGLQKFAPFAVPTMISWSGSAASKPRAKAVVLPRVPSLEGEAAVIVAPNVLRSGKRVPFVLDGQKKKPILPARPSSAAPRTKSSAWTTRNKPLQDGSGSGTKPPGKGCGCPWRGGRGMMPRAIRFSRES
ncbi:MAG: hypothetical protein M5R42_18935 [Rhodocyclaceae bacterium]|nr:hypothetical protein [Rhodocyclaceae bacterium]